MIKRYLINWVSLILYEFIIWFTFTVIFVFLFLLLNSADILESEVLQSICYLMMLIICTIFTVGVNKHLYLKLKTINKNSSYLFYWIIAFLISVIPYLFFLGILNSTY